MNLQKDPGSTSEQKTRGLTGQQIIIGVLLLLVLFLAYMQLQNRTQDLAKNSTSLAFVGQYRANGINPDGSRYTNLTVTISRFGEYYRVVWDYAGRSVSGVGTLIGNTFTVGYAMNGVAGIAVYKIRGSTLEGRWQSANASREGTETLVPIKFRL